MSNHGFGCANNGHTNTPECAACAQGERGLPCPRCTCCDDPCAHTRAEAVARGIAIGRQSMAEEAARFCEAYSGRPRVLNYKLNDMRDDGRQWGAAIRQQFASTPSDSALSLREKLNSPTLPAAVAKARQHLDELEAEYERGHLAGLSEMAAQCDRQHEGTVLVSREKLEALRERLWGFDPKVAGTMLDVLDELLGASK